MAGGEKRQRINPKADAISHIKNKTDKLDSLEALFINAEKGRGVFAKKTFNQGDFILEYRGDLISDSEAQRRREVYTPTQRVFIFDLAGKSLCVDGAKEDGSLGRLVNDDHLNPNSRMRLVEVDKISHICLFATRPISISEEISYNYGGKDWPWRRSQQSLQPHLSAFVDTPPANVEGVSSLPEPCDTTSVDNNTAEQTQTKRKTSAPAADH
ncbi:N-lysine methyltransferase KMT5A-like [Gadus chalcogrammus]|uniref:N-lysine methyltransferase KMT5A-like n=1 Tax=Gadus chalcogrammus TaxID=1042646 RepID=UPI0024C333FF|nr:N-lysine methyltransferase KMT5A-like [Gadus chalcogrammus]